MEPRDLELVLRVLGGRRAPLGMAVDDARERAVGFDAVEREHLFDVRAVATRSAPVDLLEHRVHEVAEVR